MTAINLAADIPSGITTVEQLAIWCNNVLATLNSNINAIEGENYSQRAAQSGKFYIASSDKYRHIGRVSIELGPENLVGSSKPWTYALELSSKPLTAAMKSN
jgi:hypothetical protein